ncbi:protein TALPID3-like [Stylophora pistillata]|uniref:protein TALPID3-like n=1 Tax=Stylophora pistillata TaxID=50429 RepID=UPI000C0505F2|nr:protein TALPID3-like [Stylophora pistillata]
MEHSRQILSLTSAAVNALSGVQDFHKGKKPEIKGGLPQGTSTPPKRQDANQPVSSMNPSVATSTTNDRVVDYVSGDLQDQSSSSPLDLTFNGTQRVRVPSKLLREIKSPMERSSSSGDSRQTSREMDRVEEQIVTRLSPVKVVRHVNGPSAWVESNSTDQPSSHTSSEPVIREHFVNGKMNGVDSHRPKDRILITKQTPQVTAQHLEYEAHADKAYEGKKSIPTKGLYQGQPKIGVPILNPGEENASDVKIKRFVLNDKEKALKEQFLKRKDERRPAKKLVQPTVVSQAGETNNTQGVVSSDNPVVTAAAIAAAAASAATGPFLQLQHSLEAQISALVNNLQVLQQNQNSQQELQDKEKEQKLQQQLEERLKRLEDLQAKMLETQVHSAPVSYPTGKQQTTATALPSTCMNTNMLPVSHTATVATTAYQPAHVASSYHSASRISGQDEFAQPQYTVAGHYQPYTAVKPSYEPKSHLLSPSVIPAFEKEKVVKNTRTQTSPQNSMSSEDSPLQTPLPRKRPPVPISRYDRVKGPRSDVNTRVEKKARVRFEPEVSPSLLSYKKDLTHKGRGLLSELISHNGVNRNEVLGKENRTLIDSPFFVSFSADTLLLRPETEALSSDVGKIKTELRDILAETERLKQELTQHQLVRGDPNSGVLQVVPIGDGPSPLDEYLETTHKSHLPRKPVTSRPSGFLPSKSAHYLADAEHLLQDVQYRRQNLDNNLQSLIRRREEHDLYNFVDSIPSSNGEVDEMLRIRREVDDKIKEMNSAVQREIDLEGKGALEQKQHSVSLKKQNSQPQKAISSGTKRVEPRVIARSTVTGNKSGGKSTGKENLPQKTAVRRGKSTKSQVPSRQPARVTPAQKEVYLSSVYGRQPHYPQRTTSKAPYLHYQSPVNPKTAAVMAGIMAGDSKLPGKPAVQDLTSFLGQELTEPNGPKADARKPVHGSDGKPFKQKEDMQYFFHPRVDLSQVGEGMSRVGVPLEGQLVPMAIPLGRPKTNPALRPPIVTQQPQYTTHEEGNIPFC